MYRRNSRSSGWGGARQDYKLASREKLDQVRERPATNEIKISWTGWKIASPQIRAHIFWSFPNAMARTMWFSIRKFRFSHVNSKSASLSLTREKNNCQVFLFLKLWEQVSLLRKRCFSYPVEKEIQRRKGLFIILSMSQCNIEMKLPSCKGMQVF